VALDFAADHGWALRYDGLLYRSTDDGATWSDDVLLPGPPPTVHDIEFWDTAIGYAVGSGGYAVRSSDGGSTWTALWTPDSAENLVDIDLLGPGELWVAAADGTTWYSATGGQSWSVMEAGTNGFGGYSAVVGDPAGNAWIAGTLGAIRRFAGPPPPPVNQPPVAAFGYLATGLSIAFTDQSSDADGTVVSWQWEFGDGATSAEPSPTHLYAEAGTYFVSLTVTDDDGGIDATGAAIVAQPLPGGTFGEFTEVTPLDPLFVTPADEDFWVASAAPADVDGDGDLDIAALGFYVVYNVSVEHRLVLMSNQGPGAAERWQLTYVDAPIGELTAGASDLAWGDVDNDADPDLVVGSDGLTVLYRNDAGTLVPTPTELPGYWEDSFQAEFDLRSITWADFDNDGDLDLLLPSIWDDELFEFRTALLRNDGADGAGGFVFTDANAGLPPTPHAQTQWADADGDQDLDLLFIGEAPGTDSGFIRLFRNDGVGGFTGEEILGTLSVERGEAQWGDYDQDGDLDVLVAGNVHLPDDTYDTVLHIYRNDAEIYTPVPVIDCPECEGWFDLSAATWADYDSDGDMDILLAGTWNSGSQIEGRAKIYANVGGVFVAAEGQLPAPRSMGDRGGAFTWLDLDGEGDLDYFIAGAYFVPGGNGLVEAQMHLYVNDASSQNQPPSAPANLSAEVSLDGVVSLGWTAATDDSTPAETLTYELRLRRGSIVLTPLRLLPEPGGLSAVLEWTILGLADGHYTWKLVAVDSAYNSGPAAQGSFDVGEPPAPLFADGFESGTTGGWSAQAP
jgi:PKD repeat protein